ncbi:hypothetical protein ACHWQZ_G006697 [Mnemiopsis leidyi]
MKLAVSLLLLTVCVSAESTSSESVGAQNFLHFFQSTTTVSREALKFLDNVFVVMAQYRCNVGGADCAALRVATEEVKMAIDGASLQNTKFDRLNIARLYEASVELVDDFEVINKIRHAVIEYICKKEPGSCATLQRYEASVADALENEIRPN